jgi:hypothetical protein
MTTTHLNSGAGALIELIRSCVQFWLENTNLVMSHCSGMDTRLIAIADYLTGTRDIQRSPRKSSTIDDLAANQSAYRV